MSVYERLWASVCNCVKTTPSHKIVSKGLVAQWSLHILTRAWRSGELHYSRSTLPNKSSAALRFWPDWSGRVFSRGRFQGTHLFGELLTFALRRSCEQQNVQMLGQDFSTLPFWPLWCAFCFAAFVTTVQPTVKSELSQHPLPLIFFPCSRSFPSSLFSPFCSFCFFSLLFGQSLGIFSAISFKKVSMDINKDSVTYWLLFCWPEGPQEIPRDVKDSMDINKDSVTYCLLFCWPEGPQEIPRDVKDSMDIACWKTNDHIVKTRPNAGGLINLETIRNHYIYNTIHPWRNLPTKVLGAGEWKRMYLYTCYRHTVTKIDKLHINCITYLVSQSTMKAATRAR